MPSKELRDGVVESIKLAVFAGCQRWKFRRQSTQDQRYSELKHSTTRNILALFLFQHSHNDFLLALYLRPYSLPGIPVIPQASHFETTGSAFTLHLSRRWQSRRLPRAPLR